MGDTETSSARRLIFGFFIFYGSHRFVTHSNNLNLNVRHNSKSSFVKLIYLQAK